MSYPLDAANEIVTATLHLLGVHETAISAVITEATARFQLPVIDLPQNTAIRYRIEAATTELACPRDPRRSPWSSPMQSPCGPC
jgi:hypothetical protein